MTSMAQIAVVGCGYWGKNLVRNVHEIGALAAVVDANSAHTETMGKQYGVPATSWQAMLKDTSIAGVMLAVPAPQHYEVAKEALLAGKHVFVEKPLALDPRHGDELCALAAAHKRILMVGHVLQYHSAFIEMQRWLREGKLGALHYLYSHRLNLGKVRKAENCWWSFAPHDVSMLLTLAGEVPTRVSAHGTDALQPTIADMVTTHMEFASGIKAHIFVSWLNPTKEQKLVVAGEKGMLVFDDGHPWESKLLFYPHQVDFSGSEPIANKADAIAVALTPTEPLKQECLAFVSAIATGIAPKTDGVEGLGVLRVLDAAERSMQTGASVCISSSSNVETTIRHSAYFAHDTAIIDEGCVIGDGSKIWHFSHILSGTTLGKNVVVAQNVMIGPNVSIGDGSKIQNNVSLYKGVHLEEGVFCGPSCVFTNVNTPRAQVERKDEFRETFVGRWATIGANATIVCGNSIGAYALIGAGAVVTKPVKAHALMVGNPAKQIGWVSHAGERLSENLTCPREGRIYQINDAQELEEMINEKGTSHAKERKKHVA